MQKGFTLIELLVVMAIIATIAAMGFGVYKVAQAKNQMALVTNVIAFDLRRAQTESQAVDGDSQWGVQIQNSSITMFEGSSYASRTKSADEVYNLPAGFSFSGATTTVFSKLFGLPQTTGSIIITAPNNATSTISINPKGTVSY
jgi:prepilin-type N-terminal cleavage/methylation domain-containing protein